MPQRCEDLARARAADDDAVGQERLRMAVGVVGELLITAGALLLLFLGWQLWWTDLVAGRHAQASVEQLQDGWAEAPPAPAPAEPPVVAAPAVGEAFAVVHVPRFGPGWTVAVHEGTGTKRVLDKGVLGHYPGAVMPGQVGNFAMAGHRVTYGRPLFQAAELQPGDPVVVETADAWFVYRMRSAEVVTPDRVDVVAAVPGHPEAGATERLLTFTTCHPKYSARQRYVVHAVMESWQPKADGAPTVLAAAG